MAPLHPVPGPAPAGADAMPMKVSHAMPMKVQISSASPLWSSIVGWDRDTSSCDTGSAPASEAGGNSSSWARETTSASLAAPTGPTALRSKAAPFLTASSLAAAPLAMSPTPWAGGEPAARERGPPKQAGGAAAKKKKAPAQEAMSTVMLCNLPFDQTCDNLIDVMDSMGFAGQFDFVYVPMNVVEMRSVGYAFVNLVTHAVAKQFMSTFEGFEGWASELPAVACQMRWSCCNGLAANIKRNQHNPIMADSVPAVCKPVLLKGGVRIPFPQPVKKLRTLRHRAGGRPGCRSPGEL